MTTSPTVLIAGAGPSGLVLAIDLARRGVALRIVDKAPKPPPASRAKGLQPRTLEIFHDLGMLDKVLAGGGPFPRWRSYSGGSLRWERSIWQLLGQDEPAARPDRPFAATWMIPQFRTEAILRGRLAELGGAVESGELLSCEQDGVGVTVLLKNADGSVASERCRYLIGADGGRSTVRKALGIPFEGETREDERYLIADVEAAGLDHQYWHNWSIDGDAIRRISMCPLPGTDLFQLVAPLEPGAAPPELTLATLQQLFDSRAGRGDVVVLSGLSWISLSRTQLRLAKNYRQGSVFLVGDAAHSPPQAGGQGLNIGLQDSYNLGWKLAAALAGADPGLLDSYEIERRPFAAGKLGRLAAELEAAGWTADAAAERQREIQQDLFHLDLDYRHSPIVREARQAPAKVRAGDRAPDAHAAIEPGGPPMQLFDLFRGPQTTLLAFSRPTAELCAAAASARPEFLRTLLVQPPAGADPGASVHEIYGVEDGSPTLLAIRPDGYVGLAADENLPDELSRYLKRTA